MSETNDNSSLPLLLGITAAIVLCVGGGWFLLDLDDAPPPPASADRVPAPDAPAEDTTTEEKPAISDLDLDLRKARMAAQSDLLAFPGEQSALHFYNRVLKAKPDHDLARAEFDDVLDRIAEQVSGQLEAGNFDDAYGLASRIAEQEPEHPIVRETQSSLDEYATELADRALRAARDGEDRDADAVLANVAALPGRDADYVSTLRASIAEIRKSRLDAEKRRQQASDAAEKSRNDWLNRFDDAIAAGRLIAPAGNNARDFLAGDDVPPGLEAELTDKLVASLVSAGRSDLDDNRLAEAETMLRAAARLGGDRPAIARLDDAIHKAYVWREENTLRPLNELNRVNNVVATYPRRAEERGTTGWVELTFTVTPSGETTDIEVVRAEPEKVFDAAAIDAASQWRFEPREYRGEIISQRVLARLVFRLQ